MFSQWKPAEWWRWNERMNRTAMHHLKVKMSGAVDQKIELENKRSSVALHSIMQTKFSFIIIIFIMIIRRAKGRYRHVMSRQKQFFSVIFNLVEFGDSRLPERTRRTCMTILLDGWKFYDDDSRCLWIMSTGWSSRSLPFALSALLGLGWYAAETTIIAVQFVRQTNHYKQQRVRYAINYAASCGDMRSSRLNI